MKNRILVIATLAILCFGSLVFGQNSNSSTTMDTNKNMGNMNMMGRRHGRRHRKHRRHRRGRMANKNANTE